MFARLTTFCYRHRFVTLLVWVAILAGGVAAAGPVFSKLAQDSDVQFESTDAYDEMDRVSTDGDTVIGLVDDVDPQATGTKEAVGQTVAAIRRIDGVQKVETGPQLVAPDGRAMLIVVTLDKDDEDNTAAEPVTTALRNLPLDGAKVEVGGSAVLNKEINEQVSGDLSRAELISLPLTLLFMVFVFAGFVAAGLPVIGAIISIGAAMLGLWGFSTFAAIDTNTITVVTMLGLGLSIDYGLLMVSRYREELAHGHEPEVAIGRTGATAGRTIAFSALTAAAALGGLLAVRVPFMQAIGVAGVSIAVVTMLVALTAIPALIRVGGRRIKPRKAETRDPEQGFFGRLARSVQRRPLFVLVGTLLGLLVLASPLLGAKLTDPGLDGIPDSIESKRVITALTDRFGRSEDPAVMVLARTDTAALDTWAAGWADDGRVAKVYPAEEVASGLSKVEIDVKGDSRGGNARDLVVDIRGDRPPGGESWVSGNAGFFHDALSLLARDLPIAIGLMVLAMFVLLFLMTGSVVIPVKALLMNVVSMGATFGLMVAVFQWGWGAGPADFLVLPGVDPFLAVILFAFAFGLSMDYEVFLLSRIKEAYDSGLENDTAVRTGLQRSGRIITSAAACMVIVFACFMLGGISTIEQIGFGLVVAVIVDATIVRCLLVPATMTLLGRVNWWAPGPLRRVHARFGLREHVEPAPVERELVDAN